MPARSPSSFPREHASSGGSRVTDSVLDAALDELLDLGEDSSSSDAENDDVKNGTVEASPACARENPPDVHDRPLPSKPKLTSSSRNGRDEVRQTGTSADVEEPSIDRVMGNLFQSMGLSSDGGGSGGKPEAESAAKAMEELFRQMAVVGDEDADGGVAVDDPFAKKKAAGSASPAPTSKPKEEKSSGKNKTGGSVGTKTKAGESRTRSAPATATDEEDGIDDVDQTVADLLRQMSDPGNGPLPADAAAAAAQMENMSEEVMEEMMKEMQSMSQTEDYDNVVDTMMKQLMCKDVMYEPMKGVMDKFPRWLAENRSKLSEEDYNRYGHQYQYFQRIVAVYEHDPDNFPRLMELMSDIQEFGQPPPEIIRELAPGLEMDEDGMPKMDSAAGPGGMPFPPMMGGGDNEQCRIM